MPDGQDASILVIGAGLGRTGTKSVTDALEILYKKPCYHLKEIMEKHLDHVELWSRLFGMLDRDPESELPEDVLGRLFKNYSLATDYPACSIYKQLMRIYPEAKLVLTERDPYKWIKSVRETICPKKSLVGQYFFNRIMKTILCSNFPQMVTHAIQHSMGPNVDLNNDEQMIQGFIRWNQEVKKVVPADKLLVFNVKDGWEPLCTFLNKPIPDVRFPRFNEHAHAKSRMKRYYKRALCRMTAVILAFQKTVLGGLRWIFNRRTT